MDNKEYKKVIGYVKEEVANGNFKVGDKLPTERKMAESLGLGRYSIREALRVMDNMGLINSIQGSGNYLAQNIGRNLSESLDTMLLLKQVSLSEISQLRRIIELHIIETTIHNISDEQIAIFEGYVNIMGNGTIEEVTNADKEFHYDIMRIAGNKLIECLMDAIASTCEKWMQYVLKQKTLNCDLAITHKNMLYAMKTKDVEKAKISVNRHYDLLDSLKM